MLSMPPLDLAAFAFFIVCWLFYAPLLTMLSRGTLLNTDMTVIRGRLDGGRWRGARSG